MKLTDNFTLQEFTKSETAMRYKIEEQYNPDSEVIENLKYHAENISERIRAQFGPYSPTCAYRCLRVNKFTPGAALHSEHLSGEAEDETFIKNGKNISSEVFFWILNGGLPKWSRLIWEHGDEENPNWLHIGSKRAEEHKMVLVTNGSGYLNYFESELYKIHQKKGLIK